MDSRALDRSSIENRCRGVRENGRTCGIAEALLSGRTSAEIYLKDGAVTFNKFQHSLGKWE